MFMKEPDLNADDANSACRFQPAIPTSYITALRVIVFWVNKE